MNDPLENLQRNGATWISRAEYESDPDKATAKATKVLVESLSRHLTVNNMETWVHEDRVEFRCDLFAGSAEQFFTLVNELAARIAFSNHPALYDLRENKLQQRIADLEEQLESLNLECKEAMIRGECND